MAHLSGLSRILRRDINQFVPLDTASRAGKPIYIYGPLAARLSGLSQTNLNYFMRRLQSLAATAGGASSFSNINDAAEHRSLVDKYYVVYKVFLSTGDPNYPSGIFITKMVEANFFGDEPAPYFVRKERDKWLMQRKPKENIETTYVAVNGLCESAKRAAEDIMPEMVSKSWEGRKWAAIEPKTVDETGFTMMNNPQCLYSDGKKWKSPKQKLFSKKVTAQRLARQMLSLQKRGKKTLWTVHGNGAELFRDSLKELGSAQLDNMTVLFCAPTINMSELAAKARSNKFNLHDDVIKINSEDWLSRYHQALDGKALRNELKHIAGFEEKAEELFRDCEADALKMTGIAASIGVKTFKAVTQGATFGLLEKGINYATHGARAIRADVAKIREYQLAAANKSTNHKINPHMMPFKNKTQTIMQVEQQDKAGVESFISLVKTMYR